MYGFKAIVRGKVQGVFYRATCRARANELMIRGFVRNKRDGSVEIVAIGSKNLLEKLLEWAKKGPPGARVDEIEIEWLKQEEVEDINTTEFSILPDD